MPYKKRGHPEPHHVILARFASGSTAICQTDLRPARERRRIAGAGELPGSIVLGPSGSWPRVGQRGRVLDVRQGAEEEPPLVVERRAVEDLGDDFDVGGI